MIKLKVGAFFALVSMSSAIGCSSDTETDGTGGGAGHAGSGDAPSCQTITDACHDVDALSAKAAECHGTAHEDVEEDCKPVVDECVAHCATLGIGGEGGEGGAAH